MPETAKYFCIDRIVPPADAWFVCEKAIKENPANESPFEAALNETRRWRPGHTLHVAFLEGSPLVEQKVVYYAQHWCKYANIILLFDNHPEAQIRITFRTGNAGTWSVIGTYALIILPDQPIINYSWLTPTSTEAEFSHAVLREFGHALGLLHEHQSPKSGIQWNIEAVKAYFAGYSDGWLEINIFTRYNRLQARSSAFDPHSIMVCYIPKELTLNHLETPINTTLSETDKQFIRKWYP